MKYKREGNTVFVEMVKVFLNSLYGKFGQKTTQWEEYDGDTEFIVNGYSAHYDVDDDQKELRFRKIGGVVHVQGEETESAYSFPAIAAHITADARLRTSMFRELAGFNEVFYCDTDSLFTSETGSTNLLASGVVDDPTTAPVLGMLKLEKSSTHYIQHGSKDYEIGEGEKFTKKTKGLRKNNRQVGPDEYVMVSFRGFPGSARANELDRSIINMVRKKLKRAPEDYTKGIVQGDGWVTPLHLTTIEEKEVM
jgi:hypothetical protein